MRLWHLFVFIMALGMVLAIARDPVGRVALIVFVTALGEVVIGTTAVMALFQTIGSLGEAKGLVAHAEAVATTTLVLVLSDFGRTPKVNPSAGRDHWSTAGIALMAGGGLRPGIVVGRTNAMAEQPTEAPYYTEDVAATIYHCLGIPLDTTHLTPDGRPIRVNSDGRVIRELV